MPADWEVREEVPFVTGWYFNLPDYGYTGDDSRPVATPIYTSGYVNARFSRWYRKWIDTAPGDEPAVAFAIRYIVEKQNLGYYDSIAIDDIPVTGDVIPVVENASSSTIKALYK